MLVLTLVAAAALAASDSWDAEAEAAAESEGTVAEETTETTETVVEKTKHDVVPANTLWDLAEHYYRDPWLWPRIYDANKDRIRDPHWIYPGQNFIIPGLDRTVTVVAKNTKPAPEPEPEPVIPIEPRKPKAPPPSLQEDMPESFDDDLVRLSETMPEGLVAYGQGKKVPSDWKGLGVVETKVDESLGIVGDLIEFKTVSASPAVGAKFTIFRKGETRGKEASLVRVATIQVVSVAGSKARAEILSSTDAVIEGDWVEKE